MIYMCVVITCQKGHDDGGHTGIVRKHSQTKTCSWIHAMSVTAGNPRTPLHLLVAAPCGCPACYLTSSRRHIICSGLAAFLVVWLRPHPCQSLGMPPGVNVTVQLIPRAAVLPCFSPTARPPARTWCPSLAAKWHVAESHGQLCTRAPLHHLQVPATSGQMQPSHPTGSCAPAPTSALSTHLPSATTAQVHSFHGHKFTFSLSSCSTDRP
jgi:hypothetical protein